MSMRNRILTLALLGTFAGIVAPVPVLSQSPHEADCNRPAAEPVMHVPLVQEPLFLAATGDGCWLFVRTLGGLSVFGRQSGTLEPAGEPLALEGGGQILLTHDETMLIGRLPGQLVFFDVRRLVAGDTDARLGTIESPRFMRPAVSLPGTLLVTPDDRYLIASHHSTAWLSVVDLMRVRSEGASAAAIVGSLATGEFPSSVRLSRDGRSLYLLNRAPDQVTSPVMCQDGESGSYRVAGISRLDLGRLLSGADPFVSHVPVGCGVWVMTLSPSGARAYAALHARGEVLAFEMPPAGSEAPPRLVGTVPVGAGPREIAVIDDGRTILVAHESSRFVTVIDAARIESGASAVRGMIPAGTNVTGLTVSADGRALFVPNRAERTVQVVDLSRLSLEPMPSVPGAR
jgi:DNA-binding beta-propeller fold protein YncE